MIAAACLVVVTAQADAGALGALAYRTPEERALAVGGAAWVFRDPAWKGWFVEAGQRYPFAIDGLDVTQARAGVAGARWAWLGAAAMLDSPVGAETSLALAGVHRGDRWLIELALHHHTARLAGAAGASLVTVSVAAQVHTRRALIGYAVEGYRLAGEPLPGADTGAYVVVGAGALLSASATVRFRRAGEIDVGVGAELRAGRNAYAAVGYEDGAGMLNGALGVRAKSIGLCIGVSLHPVLGVSKSVCVRWDR